MRAPACVSDKTGLFQFPQFLPSASACFSSRIFDAEIEKDRNHLLSSAGISSDRHVSVKQVHGNRVFAVSSAERGSFQEADGLVTGERNLALLIRTADCAPVFLYDPEKPAIGLVHAGWRGVRRGIVGEAVRLLKEKLGSNPARILAGIGPSICAQCYEVGDEFREKFPEKFLTVQQGRLHLDLSGLIRSQLKEEGFREESVFDSSLCTACDTDRFFSARKEGIGTGRLISAIFLK